MSEMLKDNSITRQVGKQKKIPVCQRSAAIIPHFSIDNKLVGNLFFSQKWVREAFEKSWVANWYLGAFASWRPRVLSH